MHSQNIIRLITCHWGIIGTLKLMVGWVLRWLSAVRARLRQGLDLLLPCAISSWCCSEQAHGVHASARVSGCAGFSYRAGGQIGSAIGSSSSPLPFCVGAVAACAQSGYPAHVAAGAADARGSIARSAASHSVPLHAKAPLSAHQAFGIGTIGLGEAGRLPDKLLALVRGWIARVVRCVTKVRDGFRCGLIGPSLTLRRLRPYRSSNRTARRDPRGCMPVPRPPTTPGRGDNWTMADRALSTFV